MRKTNFIYIWLNTRHAYTLIWLCEFLFFCVSWKIPLFQSRLNKQAVKLLEMLIVLLLMWIGNIYSIAIGKSTWHNNSWFLPSMNWAAKPFAGKKATFSTIIFHKFSYQYAFFSFIFSSVSFSCCCSIELLITAKRNMLHTNNWLEAEKKQPNNRQHIC